MRVFVLAGGEGRRMEPWSSIIPKCLLPINGVPAVRHIITMLEEAELYDIVLCTNRQFEPHFRYEFKNDSNIKMSVTDSPSGTAGEVFHALQHYPVQESFMVVYGDDLTKIDYKEMLVAHQNQKEQKLSRELVTVAVTNNVRLDVGVVSTLGDYVLYFYEKPLMREICDKYVWIGVAIFEPYAVPYFKDGEDIASDVFSALLLADKFLVHPYITSNEWVDIGNYIHYKRANEIFLQSATRWGKN